MGKRENKVETYLNEQIVKLGGITRKWVSPGHDGVPDRIVILKGEVIFVEVKTTDGVESSVQRRERDRLKAAGARIYTVYGEQGIDHLIRIIK